ncbi:hypothetical protein [Lentilactobacillus sp. Marseille-Q4993]|uniref:hypothetical protein n=1 Tax=Lentilactobacillus sp. Marseille-Q4993 TaxID=3039492 RepID=UPI0024BD0CEE|nr:hypothetical protein [Lentilactobacillus sp. Marseille-Q4993]
MQNKDYDHMNEAELMDAYEAKFNVSFPILASDGDPNELMRIALKTGKPYEPHYSEDRIY